MKSSDTQLHLDIGKGTIERRALVPKDWLTNPLFLAGEQPPGRCVLFRGTEWTMGIPNPFKSSEPSSRIDFNHIRLFIALLSLRFPGLPTINASIRQICAAYGWPHGSTQRRLIKGMIHDLRNYWIRVTDVSASKILEFSLIHGVALEKELGAQTSSGERQVREFVDDLRIHPHFETMLQDVERILHVRVDVLNSLPTNTARALYLYIPSRAIHQLNGHSRWSIRTQTLLEQVGVACPPHPSLVKRVLDRSVAPLDGVGLLGPILRCNIVYDKPKNPCIEFWTERREPKKSFADSVIEKDGVLVSILKAQGWSTAQIRTRLQEHARVPSHILERLNRCSVNTDRDQVFLEIACTLIGVDKFEFIVSDLYQDVIGGKLSGSASAILNHRLKDAVKAKRPPLV